MKKSLFSILIIGVLIAIVIVNFWDSNKNEKEVISAKEEIPGVDLSEVQIGNPAPDFALLTLEGEKITLSDYQGKKVILNFWATWCPPCKAEMPHMQSFYEKNKENGIEIIAVNLTKAEKHGKDKIADFIKEYGLTFPVPLDEDGSIGMQYQAFSMPTSYIIDTKGIITQKIIGPMDEAMMETFTKDIE